MAKIGRRGGSLVMICRIGRENYPRNGLNFRLIQGLRDQADSKQWFLGFVQKLHFPFGVFASDCENSAHQSAPMERFLDLPNALKERIASFASDTFACNPT